ncbi:hypothetical protein RHMOL_Rhmol05G0096100 [Rhododendron molle]|uniref:Uncharacterized protein n=1 Tax=Rhododendron molle TaxID=49168 RepID=A0ACC0NLZ9_RHOML|nr:hypothetical protein RHMOL_Rhmol05G0096100 [Rhododendron molle]
MAKPSEAEAVASRTKPSSYDRRAEGARPSRAPSSVAKEAYYTLGRVYKLVNLRENRPSFDATLSLILSSEFHRPLSAAPISLSLCKTRASHTITKIGLTCFAPFCPILE